MSQKTKKNQKPEKCLSDLEGKALKEDMKRFGYLLPTNGEELEAFNNIFGTTKVMLPQHLKSPDFLNKEAETNSSKLKPIKDKDADNDKKKVANAPVKKITAN